MSSAPYAACATATLNRRDPLESALRLCKEATVRLTDVFARLALMSELKRDVDQTPLLQLKSRCINLITLNISYSCLNGACSITCGTMRFASRSARARALDAPNDVPGTSIQIFRRAHASRLMRPWLATRRKAPVERQGGLL